MEKFMVNVSSVKSFLKCRRRWYYEWVLDRVPRKGQKALTFGKLLHEVFEAHFKTGISMKSAINLHITQLQEYVGTEGPDTQEERDDILAAVADLETLREPLEMWKDQYVVGRTLEVEEAFEFPHPKNSNIIIRGRPDRVAIIFGKLFHIQNRSLAPGKNIGMYTQLMQRDMHELIYSYALQKKYPEFEYGGTLFNLVRKLKYRSKPTKAEPEGKIMHGLPEILGQYMMHVDEEQVQKALDDLLWVAQEMRKTVKDWEEGRFPASNRDMDAGFFGNTKDAYFEVLKHGEHLLYDDAMFKPREVMYPVREEE